MRFDFFLIWGNAIKHSNHIINIINKSNDFEILRVVLHDIDDMPLFVQRIYECDSVPIQHLVGKTRYLLSTPPRCLFILTKNIAPDEAYHGEGSFRHIQCNKVVAIKKEIRNLFNPRFEDKSKTIPPLNQGVSHNHCIHASDYESQVEHVLSVLKLQNIDFHKSNEALGFNLPFYISLGSNHHFINMRLEDLRADILQPDGIISVPLKETPHYQFLKGNKVPYIEYFYSNMGKKLQSNHFPCTFEKLISEFRDDYTTRDGKKSHIVVKGNRIKDGLHRACIMLSRGQEDVECIQIL